MLQGLARLQVLDRRIGAQHIGLGLGQLGLVVLVVDLHQKIAGLDELEIAARGTRRT